MDVWTASALLVALAVGAVVGRLGSHALAAARNVLASAERDVQRFRESDPIVVPFPVRARARR